jgi:hypothetical protein
MLLFQKKINKKSTLYFVVTTLAKNYSKHILMELMDNPLSIQFDSSLNFPDGQKKSIDIANLV